jgi:hypothetical protein
VPNRDCLLPVAAEWLQRNPEVAVAWLEQSALSEKDRAEALQRAKRQRRARFGHRAERDGSAEANDIKPNPQGAGGSSLGSQTRSF